MTGNPCGARGAENPRWNPAPGKHALHQRLHAARGRASAHICTRCDEAGRPTVKRVEWAQVHETDGTDLWADYLPLCTSCHRAYDYAITIGALKARWAEPEFRARRLAELSAKAAKQWEPGGSLREAFQPVTRS
jgi:hypothetical protein